MYRGFSLWGNHLALGPIALSHENRRLMDQESDRIADLVSLRPRFYSVREVAPFRSSLHSEGEAP